MRNALYFIWEVAKIVIIALVIVIPIRYFLFQPFLVKGASMEPNFQSSDYLVIDEITYKFRTPERGEVVVFRYPHDLSQRYIKRIIGLPGETVEIKDGKLLISNNFETKILDESNYLSPGTNTPGNVKITLDDNDYFVLGDNRNASSDSRSWGTLPKKDIIGRVFLRAFPFANLARFETPSYQFLSP